VLWVLFRILLNIFTNKFPKILFLSIEYDSNIKKSKIFTFEDFFHFLKNDQFWTIFGLKPITYLKNKKYEYEEVALESAKNSPQN
jgi:hypothetical protein